MHRHKGFKPLIKHYYDHARILYHNLKSLTNISIQRLDLEVECAIRSINIHARQVEKLKTQLDSMETRLVDRIAALQALDIDYKNKGKIIICASVAHRDIVHIIDIPHDTSWEDWRIMTKEIESQYGARVEWVDSIPTIDKNFWR